VSRNEVVGVRGVKMEIRLSAPPIDGTANATMVKFLPEVFAVGTRAVKIIVGQSSRSTIVDAVGMTEREVHDVIVGIKR
jgi:uncharacterized protein (TIGR00251 family)